MNSRCSVEIISFLKNLKQTLNEIVILSLKSGL